MEKATGNSLSEVHSSVDVREVKGFWKKLFAFLGPAYLVSVGYMDPGNWATDIAGGSQFGYKLIWVLLMSNLIALLLQSLSARLGLVRGIDLAQASRQTYHPLINVFLYVLAEIAIAACDLAEVLGMAIGLQLLFKLPLLYGVAITVLDTFLLLFMLNYGIRKMEAFIIALIAVIGLSFLTEMFLAQPDPSELVKGFIPSLPGESALFIAIGIIGATVMPHNLYLHSSLVQTRKFERTEKEIKKAIRFNFIDSAIALNLAFFVNAAILILAAATFFKNGNFKVAEIQEAHRLMAPLLGSQLAPVLFAIALIAAGQSSTITGTLAGQIVMEGYLNIRIQPWIRRLITRLLAIVPALITILYFGEEVTGKLLILSQVILSLQLGFAVIPLIHFVSSKEKMGNFAITAPVKIFAWISASIIVILNVKLVIEEISNWINNAGDHAIWLWITVVPAAIITGLLLLYVIIRPLIKESKRSRSIALHDEGLITVNLDIKKARKIAITVDFSRTDQDTIAYAINQGGISGEYLLIHIVETPGALVLGQDINDYETRADKDQLKAYEEQLKKEGYDVVTELGYGNASKVIPGILKKHQSEFLVMGAHGHKGLKDIFFGTTVDSVRHAIDIPVLVIKNKKN